MDEEEKTPMAPEGDNANGRGKDTLLDTGTMTDDVVTKNEAEKNSLQYKKRSGTSAMMAGALYKSNFLSLILYRSLNDKINFLLGCNVYEIGSMGEICYRYHHDNTGKPVVVFMKTKFKDAITDNDLNNDKSDFNLFKCFQNFLFIIDKFDKGETDMLFKGSFEDIEPFLVIYSPNSCKIKERVEVSDSDKIFTNKVDSIINGGKINKIFQIRSKTLVDEIIYDRIEYIGKIMAAYVTSTDGDLEKVNEEMIRIFDQYQNFLIPDVIQINELNENCYGSFNESIFKSGDKYHIQLKEVLFKEVLRKKKVSYAENYENLILLLSQKGDITTLIANGLTIIDNNKPLICDKFLFDEFSNKLVVRPDLPLEFLPGDLVKSLNEIEVTKVLMEEALERAGQIALKPIKILITTKMREKFADTNNENTGSDFKYEIKMAALFLNSLYLYTEQGKDLSMRLKKEIAENQILDASASIIQCKPELFYLQFYNKVQKWWLLQDDPYYLTNNNCDYHLEMGTAVNFPYLSILNFSCVNELESHSLKFKLVSTDLFKNIGNLQSSATINIVSNDVLISGMKFLQFLNQSDKSFSFADFEHVSNMKDNEFEILLEELCKTNIDTFVIVMYAASKNKWDRLQKIVEKFINKTVIVSKSELTDIKPNNVMKDGSNSLADIESDDEFLKYKIYVQGIEKELNNIIDGTMKHLVNAEILSKIIKRERIDVGKTLSDPLYEELRNYFAERKIRNDKNNTLVYEQQLSVFLDIEEPVVTIIAAPGMGKSKLLTHLSIQTKSRFPYMWVVRMNLLDYSEDFFDWHTNKTVIGLKESFYLVCKAEIGNIDKFSLEELDGVIVLNNKELEGTALLHLELIIHSFNEGYIFLIFDGFDEICPDYEKETVQFMKNFIDWNKSSHSSTARGEQSKKREIQKRRIWITSRPYNTIKQTLMQEFSTPFYLQHLTKDEQTLFYHKYWEDHIKIETLSKEQFDNVEAFFKYMQQYRKCAVAFIKPPTTSIVPLRLMHEAAVDYFWSKISSTPLDVDKGALLNRWISRDELQTVDKCVFIEGRDRYIDGLELAGTPLHMHIYADLFVSEIMGTSSCRNWEPDVHSFEFYERFLETKLKKIRLQEKGREDVSSSASKSFYEEEKEICIEHHKLLAVYSVFHGNPLFNKSLMTPEKWQEIQNLIEVIQVSAEKSGLVDRIHRGVPRFVHLVFAEYFAVEFIADLLKNSRISNMPLVIEFVINTVFRTSEGIISVFDHKLNSDEKLREILTREHNKRYIFEVLMEQLETIHMLSTVFEGRIPLQSTLVRLVVYGAKNTAKFLLQSLEGNLDLSNTRVFVNTVDIDFFVFAVKYVDLFQYVIDCIREVDPSMVDTVFDRLNQEDGFRLQLHE